MQRETERLKFVTERAGGGKEKERVAVKEETMEVVLSTLVRPRNPVFHENPGFMSSRCMLFCLRSAFFFFFKI